VGTERGERVIVLAKAFCTLSQQESLQLAPKSSDYVLCQISRLTTAAALVSS